MRDEYESKIRNLQIALTKSEEEVENSKLIQTDLQTKIKDLTTDTDLKAKEIDSLKKELAKQNKISEQRIEQLNQSNRNLMEQTGKLKNEILQL
jgi:chromosome segregation ATPase